MSRSPFSSRALFCAVATLAVSVGTDLQAALLTLDGEQRITSTVGTPVNLTTSGGLDWAYWAPASGTELTPPVAPTNEKSGGVLIGNLESVGGGNLRGSATATTVERYTWTDGTSPATGTSQGLAGLIFNAQTGTSGLNKGWKLTITGDPTVERLVTLYVGGYGSTGSLSLTLAGATTVTDTSEVYGNSSPKHMDVYTLRFRPDSADDLLTIQYTASAISDTTNGHVGLQAVTVAIVPEPASAGLLFLGSLLACRRRRA